MNEHNEEVLGGEDEGLEPKVPLGDEDEEADETENPMMGFGDTGDDTGSDLG